MYFRGIVSEFRQIVCLYAFCLISTPFLKMNTMLPSAFTVALSTSAFQSWDVKSVMGALVNFSLNGEKVTEYNYDAWGNLLAIRISSAEYEELAMLNPFRYRSYVWDLESELYYLRNRYYGPEKKKIY